MPIIYKIKVALQVVVVVAFISCQGVQSSTTSTDKKEDLNTKNVTKTPYKRKLNVEIHPIDTIRPIIIDIEQVRSPVFTARYQDNDLVLFGNLSGSTKNKKYPNSRLVAKSRNSKYALIANRENLSNSKHDVILLNSLEGNECVGALTKEGFEGTWQSVSISHNGNLLSSNYYESDLPITIRLHSCQEGELKELWSMQRDSFMSGATQISPDGKSVLIFEEIRDFRKSNSGLKLTHIESDQTHNWVKEFHQFDAVMASYIDEKDFIYFIAVDFLKNTKYFVCLNSSGETIKISEVDEVGNYSFKVSSNKENLILVSGADYFVVFSLQNFQIVSSSEILERQYIRDVSVQGDTTFVLGYKNIQNHLEYNGKQPIHLIKMVHNKVIEDNLVHGVKALLYFHEDSDGAILLHDPIQDSYYH